MVFAHPSRPRTPRSRPAAPCREARAGASGHPEHPGDPSPGTPPAARTIARTRQPAHGTRRAPHTAYAAPRTRLTPRPADLATLHTDTRGTAHRSTMHRAPCTAHRAPCTAHRPPRTAPLERAGACARAVTP
ncbi:hypothetical protein GCM10018793_34330 [Streptomyces sulfonofaciens]|uniref:Uncharacterized protein n=1 Tax=Streptomyces sulfonofaciens TaxID=68272 RepID=A0A919G964_9ACTN|nr:hypothetical protein GCM10018793_34330 [Streptomyces sulfonofaciens]